MVIEVIAIIRVEVVLVEVIVVELVVILAVVEVIGIVTLVDLERGDLTECLEKRLVVGVEGIREGICGGDNSGIDLSVLGGAGLQVPLEGGCEHSKGGTRISTHVSDTTGCG